MLPGLVLVLAHNQLVLLEQEQARRHSHRHSHRRRLRRGNQGPHQIQQGQGQGQGQDQDPPANPPRLYPSHRLRRITTITRVVEAAMCPRGRRGLEEVEVARVPVEVLVEAGSGLLRSGILGGGRPGGKRGFIGWGWLPRGVGG